MSSVNTNLGLDILREMLDCSLRGEPYVSLALNDEYKGAENWAQQHLPHVKTHDDFDRVSLAAGRAVAVQEIGFCPHDYLAGMNQEDSVLIDASLRPSVIISTMAGWATSERKIRSGEWNCVGLDFDGDIERPVLRKTERVSSRTIPLPCD